MAISLKVPVATLIEKVEAQRNKVIEEHAAAVAKYEAELPRWQERINTALMGAQGMGDKLEVEYVGYGRKARYAILVPVKGSSPEKPTAKPNVAKVDRDLGLLKATTQDTISVRADSDLAGYL